MTGTGKAKVGAGCCELRLLELILPYRSDDVRLYVGKAERGERKRSAVWCRGIVKVRLKEREIGDTLNKCSLTLHNSSPFITPSSNNSSLPHLIPLASSLTSHVLVQDHYLTRMCIIMIMEVQA